MEVGLRWRRARRKEGVRGVWRVRREVTIGWGWVLGGVVDGVVRGRERRRGFEGLGKRRRRRRNIGCLDNSKGAVRH